MIWGEPGIHDEHYPIRHGYERRNSADPCVVFIHPTSMGYTQFRRFHRRYGYPAPEDRRATIDPFGTVADLYAQYFAEKETTWQSKQ